MAIAIDTHARLRHHHSMRTLILAVLAIVFVAAPARAQTAWPTETPERWGLAIVDVETTGLDPNHHEMIDAGLIYTDLEGRELGRQYVKIMPTHPDRISDGARAVNGFDVEYWRANGAITEAEAVAKIVEFHRRMAGERTMLFTAYNVWFDRAFMTALLAEHGEDFRTLYHYHVLDIPSIAWGQGLPKLRGVLLAEALGIPAETSVPRDHTGITGAQFNLEAYRALMARRALAPPPARN
jgi:oligoribonuclease (3'-5' exoribonuclease)